MSTLTNSPDHTPIQPLHNPSLAAQVVVSQALIDNGSIVAPGPRGREGNPKFLSPTDNLLTPCTQKLTAARKKHFLKPQRTVRLFPQEENNESNEEEEPVSEQVAAPTEKKMEDDDENPF